MPESYEVILGKDTETGEIKTIGDIERRAGLYIVGVSGSGKTTLLKNMIFQDMDHGHGVFFLDPHGDAIDDLKKHIPAHRQTDVIVLDVRDRLSSFGINLLSCDNPNDMTEREDTFNRALDIFTKLFADPPTGSLGPWLTKFLQNSFYPLMVNQGYTIAEIPRFLQDKPFRDRLLQHSIIATDYPEVVRFWETEFAQLPTRDQRNEIESTLTRLGAFTRPHVKHIVGQQKTTLDFFQIMEQRKILFLKLSAKLPRAIRETIGTILVSELVHAIRRREDIPEQERKQFCIFVDEFHNFASDEDFGVLFTEARKYAVAATVAHQNRSGQFANHWAILGATDAAGNKLFFQMGEEDAKGQALTFAEHVAATEQRREAELVLSPHAVEDIWEKGHPSEYVMSRRRRYLWVLDLLKQKPNEKYFVFDPTTIPKPYIPTFQAFSMLRGEETVNWQDFDDLEFFRSTPDTLRRGIALLNQYYYDWMSGGIETIDDVRAHINRMVDIYECFAGFFGYLPTMRPFIPDVLRYGLYQAIWSRRAPETVITSPLQTVP